MAVASAGNLSLFLTLTDKITAPLAKVNALATNLTRRAGVLAGPSGFGRLTAAAQRVSGGISSIVPPLGELTAIGSVVGVVRLADSFGRLGATLGRSAYRVQASVTGLEQFRVGQTHIWRPKHVK